jgi:CDP-diacylglycerol--glycerol-3-phosphate 3-phosphatidyltransferase
VAAAEPVAVSGFGPSALATPANAVTIARLLITPVLLVLVVDRVESWPAVVLWLALCVTDGFDGWLARRHGTTRSGAFLDPLADKVLVIGALVALVAAGRFWWLPVALIATREVAISLFRSFWGRRGLAVPATWWAKVKTVTQEFAVGLALLPALADTSWPADVLLWLAVVLTVVTGLQYLHDGSRATRTTGSV